MKALFTMFLLFCLLYNPVAGQELCRVERRNPFLPVAGPASHIMEGKQDSIIQVLLNDFNADSLHNFILQLQSFQTRFCFAANSREVATWIRDRFQYYGCDEAVLDSFYLVDTYLGDSLEGWQYNVIGTLYGSESPELEYLMGGHHDAIVWNNGNSFVYAPGADDNGTSVATCLESMRVMQKHGFRPRTTIRFTGWAAEELGLHGSRHYAAQAAGRGDSILFYINMDMIGNDSKPGGWSVVLYQYDHSEAGTAVCSYVSSHHTQLTPLVYLENSQGSDSWAFFEQGIPTVFVQEDEFSPVYHQPADVDTNLNFPYLRETAAASCGSLVWMCLSPSHVTPAVANPGDGNSLLVSWNRVPESDLHHYNVYVGTSSGVYTSHYTTTDTSFNITGLMTDSLYYIGVSAENTAGMQGMVGEVSDVAALVTFEKGILIVEDSYGAEPGVPDSLVRQFYERLCGKYDYAYYQAYEKDYIDLSQLGKYRAIFWNINKSVSNTVLMRNQRDVKNYLSLGGNILFTLYTPSKSFADNTKYPAVYHPGDFIYDFGHTDTVWHTNGSAFNGAYPVATGYPDLEVDTLKVSDATLHHLIRIEGLGPLADASVIYRYNTGFDTTSTPGKMKHKPVGIEYMGTDYKMVMTSFPLYYMREDQCQEFVDLVMQEKFGVYPAGFESAENSQRLLIHPNPSGGMVGITVPDDVTGAFQLLVYNIHGIPVKVIRNSIPQGMRQLRLDLSGLTPGVYPVMLQADGRIYKEKLIITP